MTTTPAPTRDGFRYWVVPHTHWDREWYLTLESFRIRLAETVDGVVDLIREDPGFRFTLDGQAVLLEDYFEIRHGRQDAIRQLTAEGRLTVGPSYVLPDEFLVGGESLVRNIMLGRQVCWRYGTRPSPVGYMPDTFGHVAQLPQLLRGFGIDSFIFTRGLGDEIDELGALFRWEAPDGTAVLAIPQLGGYGNALRLGHRESVRVEGEQQTRGENALAVIDALHERFGHRLEQAGLRDMLLCNGIDHDPAQRDISDVLDECRQLRPDDEFRIATYEDYVALVRPRIADVPVFRGELCGGFEENVLRGVNSARMYLKQANEQCERELLTAETLCALAGLAKDRAGDAEGWRYPAEELRLAWRELLRNHPHDSICGCSVDEVHDDMEQRFRTTRHIAQQLQHNALQALAGEAISWSYAPLGGAIPRPERAPERVSIVNTLTNARRRLVELLVPAALAGEEALEAVVDGSVQPVDLVARDGARWARVATTVPGLSAVELQLQPVTEAAAPAPAPASDAISIANEHYRVIAAADGTIDVEVLATGRVVRGVCALLDDGDRGDEYTFCPVEHDEPWSNARLATPANARVVHVGAASSELEVDFSLELPAAVDPGDRTRRSRELVACTVRHRVRLVAGVDRIDVETTVDNAASDHRLRVLVPVDGAQATVRAEGHYDVVERAPQRTPVRQWHEQPHTTEHTLGGVAWGDVLLVSRGLPEYEAIPDGTPLLERAGVASGDHLALTLLRCVGWLSREDLTTRKLGAGPELPTPGAQCHGTHRFEYALRLGATATRAEVVHASADFRHDFCVGPAGIDVSAAVSVTTDACFGALKAAEDGTGYVLRLFNVEQGQGVEAAVDCGDFRVRRSRLDETVVEPAHEPQPAIRPGEIVTLRLLPPRR